MIIFLELVHKKNHIDVGQNLLAKQILFLKFDCITVSDE